MRRGLVRLALEQARSVAKVKDSDANEWEQKKKCTPKYLALNGDARTESICDRHDYQHQMEEAGHGQKSYDWFTHTCP